MIKAKPLSLAQKLKNIVDIIEEADAVIDAQRLIQKGALDAGKENDGIEPSVVRKMVARRKRLAKDPVETQRLEDLAVDYQFFLEGGVEPVRSAAPASDELSRVLALTNTTKPPKIEAIKKALGCSQGKAHKLRTMAAVRLAKSSSSSTQIEHEHPDAETGEVIDPQPEDGDDGITDAAGRDPGIEGESDDAPDDLRVSEADRSTDGGHGQSASGGQGVQRRAGCLPAGGAGQDVCDPGASVQRDVGERGDHATAGRDAARLTPAMDLAHNEVQPSATPSVGAVARESERVASPSSDLEMPPIPDFLRRQKEAGV